MNKISYDRLMCGQIDGLDGKKTLLLHCCCAPCSSACIERLKDYFKITVLFYNPNIESGEYEKRKAEIIRFLKETGWADFLDCDHSPEDFYTACKGLEGEKEGGARCLKCFEVRLAKTAELAENFDYFTTTLTVSPLKDAEAINNIGKNLGGGKWLFCDFKKRGGYLRSLELSKQYDLYRQNYCGCVFSRAEREKG